MSKTTNKMTIYIHKIKKHKCFTQQIENGNPWRSLYLPCFLKTQQKNGKIHVLWKCDQNKSNMCYSTPESIVLLQSTYIFTLIPEMCLYKYLQTPKTLAFG